MLTDLAEPQGGESSGARPPAQAGDTPFRAGGDQTRLRQTLRACVNVLLPAFGIGLFLFVWNYGPLWLGLHRYEVPTLSEDIQALQANWSIIGPALKDSVADALCGFFLGNLLAIFGAILFTQSRLIERTWFPLAIVFQTIPIVVIAPLSLTIFASLQWGPYDPLPIIDTGLKPILLVTVLITFFPTLVNMTVGLKDIDPNLHELMRLIGSSPLRTRVDRIRANRSDRPAIARAAAAVSCGLLSAMAEMSERWSLLWRLRLPSSMPYLFSSLKITATLCFVGAFVGEFVVAANIGVGGYIKEYEIQGLYPQVWAAVLAFVLATLVFIGFVVLAERLLFPWRRQG